jgi:hypothetical protein
MEIINWYIWNDFICGDIEEDGVYYFKEKPIKDIIKCEKKYIVSIPGGTNVINYDLWFDKMDTYFIKSDKHQKKILKFLVSPQKKS